MSSGEKPPAGDKLIDGEKLFRVRDHENQLTLAAAVRKWLGGELPWSHAERLIRTRRAIVNGNLCIDPARRLKQGDLVKLLEHSLAPPATEDDVVIRHLDTHVVVVEKPSGMTSVRHAEERDWSNKRRRANPTLEDLLPRIIAKKLAGHKKKTRGEPTISRTPPVRQFHRLDRDTSGLIIFARTVPAERSLGEQFRAHTTSRRYLAIVKGRVTERTIDTQLYAIGAMGDVAVAATRRRQTGRDACPTDRASRRLHAGRMSLRDRAHASDSHSHVRGGTPGLRREGVRPAKFSDKQADTSGAPRLALHARGAGLQASDNRRVARISHPVAGATCGPFSIGSEPRAAAPRRLRPLRRSARNVNRRAALSSDPFAAHRTKKNGVRVTLATETSTRTPWRWLQFAIDPQGNPAVI